MAVDQVPPRILVVDDDRIVADTLLLIFCARGFEGRAAYSGEDAAQIAIEWKPYARYH